MRPSYFRASGLASLLLLAACTTTPKTLPTPPPTVLMISIDGLNPAYLGKGNTPNLDRIAAQGVRAQWMNPSYPVLTFPNHYTLVTGLRPNHHGVIHNTMWQADLGMFRVGDEASNRSPSWWEDAEPIWVTAEKQGLKTAVWAWPGNVSRIHGVQPSQFALYDAKVPVETRVDTVANWALQSPAPRLVGLYFEHVDTATHHYGIGSAQGLEAIRLVDGAIGQLVNRLEQAGKLDQFNLVIVSDHGMAEVAPGNVVAIEDMVSPELARVRSTGQVISFQPLPGKQAEVEQRLLGKHERYECWRKGELPARWHYGTHPRIPAIVCQMQEGWDALPRSIAETRRKSNQVRGSHGFDPALPSMRAAFIARGPAFKRGVEIPAIDNVDVYPMISKLIGIKPQANDGNPQALLPALK